METSLKMKKRLDRLISCVKLNDLKRLEHYVRRKKYKKINLDETGINKRGETLLHLACRLCKPEIVTFLLRESLGDPTSMDLKGNTGLHLALKAVMKIDDKNSYIAAYRKMILGHLKEMAASLTQPNKEGQTAKDLLDLADSVYQYHLEGSETTSSNNRQRDEQEWQKKLAAELDDEYGNSWGKYEEDFLQEEVIEAESYDSWAERMINEHKKRMKNKNFNYRPLPQPKEKPSWTEEDQQRFIKEEENRKLQQKYAETAQKRFVFLSKLSLLLKNENRIGVSDLPFDCTDDVESICQLILVHVKELEEVENKRKALRELQRLWHPDKFSQKFGERLEEEIRESVLRKVTEISQYLNAFNYDSLTGNK